MKPSTHLKKLLNSTCLLKDLPREFSLPAEYCPAVKDTTTLARRQAGVLDMRGAGQMVSHSTGTFGRKRGGLGTQSKAASGLHEAL